MLLTRKPHLGLAGMFAVLLVLLLAVSALAEKTDRFGREQRPFRCPAGGEHHFRCCGCRPGRRRQCRGHR